MEEQFALIVGDSKAGRFQSVMATQCFSISSPKTSVGFRQLRVLRGRAFSSAATRSGFPAMQGQVGAFGEVLAEQPVGRSYVCQAPGVAWLRAWSRPGCGGRAVGRGRV